MPSSPRRPRDAEYRRAAADTQRRRSHARNLHLRPYTIPILVVALCALVAAGCQSEARAPSGGKSSIVITIPEDPPSFNGLVTDAGFDSLVMELVLQSVTDIDPQGNIFPELAAGLPTLENGGVVIDEDTGAMDVTWTLRDDVRWADGEPLTAADVLFTWEAISDPEGGIWLQGSDYIDSVEQIDDTTFVVHYTSVFPGYLTQFGGDQVVIWPAHYCDAAQGFVAWDCNRQPLSSGPYVLTEWVTGDHLTFARNPEYTGAVTPSIDQIIVRVVPEPAVRRTMLTPRRRRSGCMGHRERPGGTQGGRGADHQPGADLALGLPPVPEPCRPRHHRPGRTSTSGLCGRARASGDAHGHRRRHHQSAGLLRLRQTGVDRVLPPAV